MMKWNQAVPSEAIFGILAQIRFKRTDVRLRVNTCIFEKKKKMYVFRAAGADETS